MKYIRKGPEPVRLRQWRVKQKASPQNLFYKNVPTEELAEVRDSLLEEQGWICAYTMLRLASREKGHIEHILPQSRAAASQTDYFNMVYCFPGEGAKRCEFGAHKKAGAEVSSATFLSRRWRH